MLADQCGQGCEVGQFEEIIARVDPFSPEPLIEVPLAEAVRYRMTDEPVVIHAAFNVYGRDVLPPLFARARKNSTIMGSTLMRTMAITTNLKLRCTISELPIR